MKTIFLSKRRENEAICNRDEYFKAYWDGKKMISGCPPVINIKGHYYYIEKLPVVGNKDAYDDFLRDLKSPINNEVINWKWI